MIDNVNKLKNLKLIDLTFLRVFTENMRILSIKTAVLKLASYLQEILCKFWFYIVLGICKHFDERFFHCAGMASLSLGIILKVFPLSKFTVQIAVQFQNSLCQIYQEKQPKWAHRCRIMDSIGQIPPECATTTIPVIT